MASRSASRIRPRLMSTIEYLDSMYSEITHVLRVNYFREMFPNSRAIDLPDAKSLMCMLLGGRGFAYRITNHYRS